MIDKASKAGRGEQKAEMEETSKAECQNNLTATQTSLASVTKYG